MKARNTDHINSNKVEAAFWKLAEDSTEMQAPNNHQSLLVVEQCHFLQSGKMENSNLLVEVAKRAAEPREEGSA